MAKIKSFELEALDRDGLGVQAVFTWVDDRYGHSICGVANGQSTPLLEANSATERYGFPPAPPLQEVVKHRLEDLRPALLLTGSGEGRYWSGAVTPLTDVKFALLSFDFACRGARNATKPVVAYRVAAGVTVEVREPGGLIVLRTADERTFKLWPAAMPTSLATENIATCEVSVTRQGVVIKALGSPHVTTRSTVPWRYEIAMDRPN